MVIPCTTILSNLRPGERSCYRIVPKNLSKIDEVDFLRRIASKLGQDPVQGRYWLDATRDELYALLAQNCAVDLGFLYAKLFIGGSLTSANAQPDRDRNPVYAKIHAKGELAQKLALIEVVNETLSVGAILYEIMQDGASDRNRIESANTRIVANGTNILIDSSDEDTGVWLENITSGIKIADATIMYSDTNTVHFKFATLPATGKYRLVIATRNGQDSSLYPAERLVRNVFVVNG